MNRIYLERHDQDRNMHRFYQIHVTPGLFDDWSLVKEWGRVGSPGTVRKEWFATEEEAVIARQALCEAKRKKGYQCRYRFVRKIQMSGQSFASVKTIACLSGKSV